MSNKQEPFYPLQKAWLIQHQDPDTPATKKKKKPNHMTLIHILDHAQIYVGHKKLYPVAISTSTCSTSTCITFENTQNDEHFRFVQEYKRIITFSIKQDIV